ncbi:hypothetical protein [Afifella aestuarii]|uniref:hypothetical protein n=1 Tax=Afifella aestuarii TaxID=1909496 RepID=UPI000FE33AA9|nr:hypothetical protein [Afifella aestuarii]
MSIDIELIYDSKEPAIHRMIGCGAVEALPRIGEHVVIESGGLISSYEVTDVVHDIETGTILVVVVGDANANSLGNRQSQALSNMRR